MSDERDPQFEYLGDGVYASFDGFHVWLHVGSHDTPPVVALEPDVFRALVKYRSRVVGTTAALQSMLAELEKRKVGWKP